MAPSFRAPRCLLAMGLPLALIAPAAAQVIRKPIVVKTVPATRPALIGGTLVARPGMRNAAAVRASLLRTNALVRTRPKLKTMLMTMPGIARVNDAAAGDFEPGGAYEIAGHGFGTAKPNVFLKLGNRIVTLNVASWADDQIFASLPDGLSGIADTANVTLYVAPPGQHAFESAKFGFRAAREDIALPIGGSMFGAMANSSATTRSEDGFFIVSRSVADTGGTKRCVPEGTDTIRWNAPLRPGFELTGYVWFHANDASQQVGSTSYTPRGKYALAIEGDMVRINYAVMRAYTPPFAAISSMGSCSSEYRVKLIVTGPRGVAPW